MLSALTFPNFIGGVCDSNSSSTSSSRMDCDYHSTPKEKRRPWLDEIPEETVAATTTVTANVFASLSNNNFPPSPLMGLTDVNRQQLYSTPQIRIVNNPFDPPSSSHLKERLASPSIFKQDLNNDNKENTVYQLPAEKRAVINPVNISENIVQIDATILNENLQQRYQQAAGEFCHRHLHLPTPAQPPPATFFINNTTSDRYGYSTATLNVSPWFSLKATPLNSQNFTSRIQLPADFESMMIQSFTSNSGFTPSSSAENTTNNDDSGSKSQSGAQVNVSLLKRRLFQDNLDEQQQDNQNENGDKTPEENDDNDLITHDPNDFEHDLDKSFTQEDWLKGLKDSDKHKKCHDLETKEDHHGFSPRDKSVYALFPGCSPIKKEDN
ncbi:unnamed protein product [Didymodactylos carnosus]|uniref:Uncharacterized protein n=1 Tax=Didymodactylos carnosus TaxID=1234261 RepID=A0A813QD78_9BILA|nr:unnamed protein product [Didymodactylos carnosus]CAF3547127.1 unnamed protein product [Didymodactylos carnosus]